MQHGQSTELVLIRHAPVDSNGTLYGRRDLPARFDQTRALDALRLAVEPFDRIVCSPAKRCVQTAQYLWPDRPVVTEPSLWEQDFGEWEGRSFTALPDLGPLSPADLASHRPPGGESFDDVCARVRRGLSDICTTPGRVAIVAHAGTIRAALAMALGSIPAALGFEIATLSLSRITALHGVGFSIGCVNVQPS